MATTLKPSVFALDDGKWIRGWTLGQKWNGWGCPYFDAEQLPAALESLGLESVEQLPNGSIAVQLPEDEEPTLIEPREIDGKRVWSFGFGYTWNERDTRRAMDALKNFSRAALELSAAWDDLYRTSTWDDVVGVEHVLEPGYPFTKDFAEVVHEIQTWAETVEAKNNAGGA